MIMTIVVTNSSSVSLVGCIIIQNATTRERSSRKSQGGVYEASRSSRPEACLARREAARVSAPPPRRARLSPSRARPLRARLGCRSKIRRHRLPATALRARRTETQGVARVARRRPPQQPPR